MTIGVTFKLNVAKGLSAAGFVFFSGVAFAGGQYSPGASDTEIKIGNTMPYSGPASAYGIIGKTEGAYFAMINEQGGINGRKINFISRDDGYSPPKTVEQTRKLKVGNGLDPDVDVGPLVDEQQLKTVLRYLEIGKKEARLLHGGVRIAGGDYENGYFVAPTVFDHVPWDSTIAQEEIFGPVLSVIRVPNFEEALRVANSVKYGLSSSIYTNDARKIFEFIDRIETGMTHVNAPTVASEAQIPFGGMKATGVGLREMGRVAIDFYTELKAVYIDYAPPKG